MKSKPWPGTEYVTITLKRRVIAINKDRPGVHNARHGSKVGDLLLCSLLTVTDDHLYTDVHGKIKVCIGNGLELLT